MLVVKRKNEQKLLLVVVAQLEIRCTYLFVNTFFRLGTYIVYVFEKQRIVCAYNQTGL